MSNRSFFLSNILLAIDACCSAFCWINVQFDSRPLPGFYQYCRVLIDSVVCQATPFVEIAQILYYWYQFVCNDTFTFSYTGIPIVHCICIIEHRFVVGRFNELKPGTLVTVAVVVCRIVVAGCRCRTKITLCFAYICCKRILCIGVIIISCRFLLNREHCCICGICNIYYVLGISVGNTCYLNVFSCNLVLEDEFKTIVYIVDSPRNLVITI